MENEIKNNKIEKIIEISFMVLFTIAMVLSAFDIYLTNAIAVFVIIIDIYTMIKYRKNHILFIIFLCITYFDYSVVVSKYLFNIEDFAKLYAQIKYNNTMFIGIASLCLMHLVTLITLSIKLKNKKFEKNKIEDKELEEKNENTKSKNIWYTIILVILTFITLDANVFHILGVSASIMEYSVILFIFSFYHFKKNKYVRWLLVGLMLINAYAIMKEGGRISIIQVILVYIFICYESKINIKRILIVFTAGIIFFTIAGLYGDSVENGGSYIDALQDLTIERIYNTFEKRKLTLDTSFSSYWTGLTFIENSNNIDYPKRLNNGLEYFTKYTIVGQKSDYVPLTTISRENYVHYWGGYLNSYFYYWFSWFGVVAIGIIIGLFMKRALNIGKNKELNKLIAIYFAATVPRWYLYYPTMIFRGFIIFLMIYFIINYISFERTNKIKNE